MENKMKKTVARILISIFVASLFGVSITQAATETTIIKGTITFVSEEIGSLGVEDENGKLHTFVSEGKIDLKGLNTGDKVLVECDDKGNIKSVAKEG